MLSADLLQRVDRYWADFLGCSLAELRGQTHVWVTSKRSPGLVALRVAQSWIVSLPPGVDAEASTPLAPENSDAEWGAAPVEALRERLPGARLTESYGPAQVLYCARETLRAGDEGGARRLTVADRPAVERFRAGMGSLAWSLDDPERWVAAFGLFAGHELISAAVVQVWGDSIGEIFVDTLAQHRRRGYARMVTRAATRWLLEETSLIPQYDAELTNPASLRVAQAIGYEPYGCLFVVSGT